MIASSGQGSCEELGGGNDAIEHAQFDGGVGPDELAAEHQPAGDRCGELMANDLDRADRVRHADSNLGEADLEVDVGDQSDVAAQGQHQSTGDRMTVHGPDDERGQEYTARKARFNASISSSW